MTTITFPEHYNFNEQSIKLVLGTVGIYFIYLENLRIPYPFGRSRLIYIGLSESKQNSIGRRLYGHLTGQSGNQGIRNYAEHHPAKFTFHTFQLLRHLGARSLYEIESVFLSDFLRQHGSFPICNNQSGIIIASREVTPMAVAVDWDNFA